MKKLKKILICLLTACLVTAAFPACAINSSSTKNPPSFSHGSVVPNPNLNPNPNPNPTPSPDGGNPEDGGGDTEEEYDEAAWAIVDEAYSLAVGKAMGYYTLSGTVTSIDEPYSDGYVMLTFVVKGREDYPIYCYKLQGEGADIIGVGDSVTVYGNIKNYQGTVEFDKNCLLMSYKSDNTKPDIAGDPYVNTTASQFYASYTPATSNTDAYYRSLHGFMSGSIVVPDQAPTLSSYRPKNGNLYVRNSDMKLSSDKKTYTVVDAYGNAAFEVYKDGAYITLEEVAAYVYAFGTYPKNHVTDKDTDPNDSVWGEYLRLNHTSFSGDTSKYPYEPVLPNISGCGGDLRYYEMDIGTTGTDCDPSYPSALYNNGYSITRGAARIVYGKNDLDKDGVYEIGEFHVFYTYNHYNDFQEYLNYEGGWGEMFGNITGGGTISSKSDYNPTDYVSVSMQSFSSRMLYTAFSANAERTAYFFV